MNPIISDYTSKIAKLPALKNPENGPSSGKNKLKEINKAYKINVGIEERTEKHTIMIKGNKQKKSYEHLGLKGLLTQNTTSESDNKLLKPANMIVVGNSMDNE